MAHHPIPAGTSSFYFEITLDASSRVDESTEEPYALQSDFSELMLIDSQLGWVRTMPLP